MSSPKNSEKRVDKGGIKNRDNEVGMRRVTGVYQALQRQKSQSVARQLSALQKEMWRAVSMVVWAV